MSGDQIAALAGLVFFLSAAAFVWWARAHKLIP